MDIRSAQGTGLSIGRKGIFRENEGMIELWRVVYCCSGVVQFELRYFVASASQV